MTYTPTTWATGDVVSSEKLNKMETGIESADNGLFVVTISYKSGNFSSDKTYEEIKSAWEGGKTPVCLLPAVTSNVFSMTNFGSGSGQYTTPFKFMCFSLTTSNNTTTLYNGIVTIASDNSVDLTDNYYTGLTKS